MDDLAKERDRAIQLAHRAVGRRERTVAELRTCLERKRVEPGAIDYAVTELTETGLLDDARYAQAFADDKRYLDRWGSERIARELQRRGIAPDLIEGVLSDRSRDAELESALVLLAQRAPTVSDDRERDRAWRLLIRRGYEIELAYEAVRRHEQGSGDERRAA
jgi:regulatory protein